MISAEKSVFLHQHYPHVSFLFVADKVCGKEEDHEGKRSNRRRDSQISNSSDSQSMIRINVRPRKVTPGSN